MTAGSQASFNDGRQLTMLPPVSPPAVPGGWLRLLTWNVQHASPSRARQQVAWLAGRHDTDMLVLTEVADTPGGRTLVQLLGEHGYSIHLGADAGGDYLVLLAAVWAALSRSWRCGLHTCHTGSR